MIIIGNKDNCIVLSLILRHMEKPHQKPIFLTHPLPLKIFHIRALLCKFLSKHFLEEHAFLKYVRENEKSCKIYAQIQK